MAANEVNVSAPRIQPNIQRRRNHPRQTRLRCLSRPPPSVECLAVFGWHSRFAEIRSFSSTAAHKLGLPSVLSRSHAATADGRGKKSQWAMRFPVYQSLYLLNRNVEDILVILEEIKKSPGMPQKSFEAYKVELQYLRSHATQDVLEVMNDTEIHEMAKLGKQKKAYDDSIRDLDDVYLEVQHREEQRRKQGLPSLIGVLPLNYQPPASVSEEAEDVPKTSYTSEGIHSQNTTKPRTRKLHGKKAARNSRPRRRPESAL